MLQQGELMPEGADCSTIPEALRWLPVYMG
jgi:hypothetical protein